MKTIKQGDAVRIKPEWQDAGDSKWQWVACSDESKGRVDIRPLDYPLRVFWTVRVSMLEVTP